MDWLETFFSVSIVLGSVDGFNCFCLCFHSQAIMSAASAKSANSSRLLVEGRRRSKAASRSSPRLVEVSGRNK